MGRHDTAFDAMDSGRQGRHGHRRIDRPPAGLPAAAAHPQLAVLLSALTAPALPEELAGERAAVAGFVRVQREAPGRPSRGRRTRRILGVLGVAVAVAVGAGTATAATTGSLPRGLQEGAHRLLSPLGVPAPGATAPSATPATGAGAPQGGPRSTAADPSGGATPLQLCQAWATEEKDPLGKHPATEALKELLDRSGSSSSIPKFCADLITIVQPAPSAPVPTPPGAASGDGRGDHPSPHPHASH
jgi:hypothetical protein